MRQETSLATAELNALLQELQTGNAQHRQLYPGESARRQAVHTVYGGAQLFKFNTAKKIGDLAYQGMEKYIPTAATLTELFAIEPSLAPAVYQRMKVKLQGQGVEDFRIDFEDGFGNRPDPEEDAMAMQAALAVAQGMREQTLPPFIGIRIKTFSEEHKRRGLRTLDLFITTLLRETGGKLPDNFVVTYPKITHLGQAKVLNDVLTKLEEKNQLAKNSIEIEYMVETPEAIFGADGACPLVEFVKVAQGRCRGAHFGTYDYTACMNIVANYQAMDHRACDFAKSFMQTSLAGTGVSISDGATNIMPVGSMAEVQRAWKLSFWHIRHSLENGFYQGWDLHPHQLPVRYAALYSFFLAGLEEMSARLKNFVEQASQATLSGAVFDDAATGQGLLNFFLRALNCGAIDIADLLATGLTLADIQTRSFAKIIKSRAHV